MADMDAQMDAKIDMIVYYMLLKKLNAYDLAGMLQAAQSDSAVQASSLTWAAALCLVWKMGNHAMNNQINLSSSWLEHDLSLCT